MSNATTFVGLDVHARSVKACAFVPETGETIRRSFGYEPCEIASWASSLPQHAKCVYESGVTGFHLCRELRSMGVDCVVGAVSKMHKPAADRGPRPTGATRSSSPCSSRWAWSPRCTCPMPNARARGI